MMSMSMSTTNECNPYLYPNPKHNLFIYIASSFIGSSWKLQIENSHQIRFYNSVKIQLNIHLASQASCPEMLRQENWLKPLKFSNQLTFNLFYCQQTNMVKVIGWSNWICHFEAVDDRWRQENQFEFSSLVHYTFIYALNMQTKSFEIFPSIFT